MLEHSQIIKNSALAIVLGSILFTYWLILPVVLGAYSDNYGLQEDRLGTLASIYSLGIFITTLTSTLWITRFPRKSQVTVGALLSALGFWLLLEHATGDDLTLLYHFISSLGLGIAYAAMMAVLADSTNPTRSFALLFFLQVVVGVVGSQILTRGVSTEHMLYVVYASMAAIGVLSALLATKFQEPDGASRAFASPLMSSQWTPPLPIVLGLLSILLVFTGDAGVWVFLERIGSAVDDRELGGSLVSINLSAGAIGSLTAAWLANRLGFLWPMIIAIGLSVLSVAMLNLSTSGLALLTASFINGWAWNFGAAYRMALVSHLDGERRFVALIPAMQTLGNAIGPSVVGAIIVWASYSAAYWLVAVLWLAALVIYYPAWKAYQSSSNYRVH
jgi:predicted MFS family arabinose efflux permease